MPWPDAAHPANGTLKRSLDLLGAGLGLVLALPLILLGALAVLIEDGRPVFFIQTRGGRDDRPFPCFKLRTLRQGPPPRPGISSIPASDPRLLGCGLLLRRLAVDELPQLLNVLRGEMSLVGPRPAQPWETAEHPPEARRRSRVRPGLTGLAQVRGRNRLSWGERLKSDLEYLDRWSLGLDLRILLRTVPTLLSGDGAFGADPSQDEPERPLAPSPDTPGPAARSGLHPP